MKPRGQSEASPPSIRVVIADDHPIVRSGLRKQLESADGIAVVGEAERGREALTRAHEQRPDVLLVDVVMPEESGLEILETLMDRSSTPRILVLSSFDDPEYVRHVMEHGASDYLPKEQAPTHIVEAVRAVARGEGRWFVSSSPEAASLGTRLTHREQEVLRALAEGYSNRELADILNVSENTIRTHTSQIYDKLDVSSAREAISLAWRSGFMRAADS